MEPSKHKLDLSVIIPTEIILGIFAGGSLYLGISLTNAKAIITGLAFIGVMAFMMYRAVKQKSNAPLKKITTVIPVIPQEISEDDSEFTRKLKSIPQVEINIVSNNKIERTKNNFRIEFKYSSYRINTLLDRIGNYVVIDTETTGVTYDSEIVEVSAIKFENFEPVAIFSTLIHPDKSIPADATKVNNITNEMVADAPTFSEIADSLDSFIGDMPLVGHNLQFDLSYLHSQGYKFDNIERKYYDTLSMSRSYLADKNMTNFKLATVCRFFDIKLEGAHRSSADSYATGLLFAKLIQYKNDGKAASSIYSIKMYE